jgi:soluble P-type ATPase
MKSEAVQAVKDLHALGIKVVMLTGDMQNTAHAIAKEVGIDDVVAEVMPDDKLQKIKELQSKGRIVAMAGDGVNDAPALAQADVGIAMGTGTDVAIETAGITLLNGDISKLVKAIHLSKITMTGIKQNLFWAKEAFKASYGYEWQGDNLLLARENALYTLIDYFRSAFKENPSLELQEEFAHIVSWNIFQMDGLKYVVPMSCHHEVKVVPAVWKLFDTIPEKVEKYECEGCKYGRVNKHNGKYVKVMDWEMNKSVKFVDIVLDKKTSL